MVSQSSVYPSQPVASRADRPWTRQWFLPQGIEPTCPPPGSEAVGQQLFPDANGVGQRPLREVDSNPKGFEDGGGRGGGVTLMPAAVGRLAGTSTGVAKGSYHW